MVSETGLEEKIILGRGIAGYTPTIKDSASQIRPKPFVPIASSVSGMWVSIPCMWGLSMAWELWKGQDNWAYLLELSENKDEWEGNPELQELVSHMNMKY